MEFALSVILFCIGLYAVIAKRNLVKIIIGAAIMGYAVNLLLMLAGFRFNSEIPILSGYASHIQTVDPVVQAMVLVSAIIGLTTTLFLTALSIKLYQKYGTFDIGEIKKLKG